MALTYVGHGAAAAFSAVSSIIVLTPAGLATDDLLVVVVGFEQVAAGSGPWISGTPQLGWSRACYQSPAGTGSGIEIWTANWKFGGQTTFNFFVARTGIARESAYRCPAIGGPALDKATTAQHTGDNPVCPSIDTNRDNTTVVHCAAMKLKSPGYVYPAPDTKRWDNARAGVFGNVEAALGDRNQAAAGTSGTYTITAATPTGSNEGATATLAVGCTSKVSRLPYMHAGP